MHGANVVMITIVGSMCLAGLVCGLTPAVYRRMSGSWIDKVGAPIDTEMDRLVQRERGGRLAWRMAGGLVGVAIGAPVLLSYNHDFSEPYPPERQLAFVGAVFLGLWSGQVLRAFTEALRPDPGSVRVARATAPRLDDFVRPRAQLAMGIAVVAAILICVALAVAPIWDGPGIGPGRSGIAWLAAGIIALSFLAGRLLVRKLIQRPSPGASPHSVVWRDALRRELVADLYVAPFLGMMLSGMIVFNLAFEGQVLLRTGPLSFLFVFFVPAMGMIPHLIHYLNQPKPTPAEVS